MRTKIETNQLTLECYGIIGETITVGAVAEALDAAGDIGSIVVRLNSPGGSVFDASAIYSRLAEHPAPVTTIVDGIALSAASFIVQAGDVRKMASAATLMLHNSWSITVGNKSDMAKAVDMLAKFDASISSIYAARSGQTIAEVCGLMDAETWFTASEAHDQGFVDEVLPLKAADNLWDLSCYSRVPRNVKNGSTPWQATVARASDLSFTMPTLHVAAMAQPPYRKDRTMTTSTPDPNARYRAEFQQAGGWQALGVTEDQYVRSRRVDDGLDDLSPRMGECELGESPDPAADERFRREFQQVGGFAKLGVTESAYVRSRRIDEGLASLV